MRAAAQETLTLLQPLLCFSCAGPGAAPCEQLLDKLLQQGRISSILEAAAVHEQQL
jgi:hypothetical protein